MKKSIMDATIEEIFLDSLLSDAFDEILLLQQNPFSGRFVINSTNRNSNWGLGGTLREALIDLQVSFLDSVNWNEEELQALRLNWVELKGGDDEH